MASTTRHSMLDQIALAVAVGWVIVVALGLGMQRLDDHGAARTARAEIAESLSAKGLRPTAVYFEPAYMNAEIAVYDARAALMETALIALLMPVLIAVGTAWLKHPVARRPGRARRVA